MEGYKNRVLKSSNQTRWNKDGKREIEGSIGLASF